MTKIFDLLRSGQLENLNLDDSRPWINLFIKNRVFDSTGDNFVIDSAGFNKLEFMKLISDAVHLWNDLKTKLAHQDNAEPQYASILQSTYLLTLQKNLRNFRPESEEVRVAHLELGKIIQSLSNVSSPIYNSSFVKKPDEKAVVTELQAGIDKINASLRRAAGHLQDSLVNDVKDKVRDEITASHKLQDIKEIIEEHASEGHFQYKSKLGGSNVTLEDGTKMRLPKTMAEVHKKIVHDELKYPLKTLQAVKTLIEKKDFSKSAPAIGVCYAELRDVVKDAPIATAEKLREAYKNQREEVKESGATPAPKK